MEITSERKLLKIGFSVGLTLPFRIKDAMCLKPGQRVDIRQVSNDCIIARVIKEESKFHETG